MAATAKRITTIGLSEILFGEIPSDGSMAQESTMKQLGYTYQDSCAMTEEDPEVNEFYVEEQDSPFASSTPKKGKTEITFQIPDVSAETLQMLKGGTATIAEGSKDKWESPRQAINVEKAMIIKAQQGVKISIPRAKIVAKLNYEFKKSSIGLLEVTATVMTPKDEETADLIWEEL